MRDFLPIYYSGFWDVPSAFLTLHKENLYFFWRDYFDEELDDYPPNYKVYHVKNLSLNDAFEYCEPPYEFIKFNNISLLLDNKIIGEISTKEVIF